MKVKTVLSAAILTGFAATTYAGQETQPVHEVAYNENGVTVKVMSHQLVGAIEHDNEIYGVTTVLDEIKTPGGTVYVQPEEYKLEKFVAYSDAPYLEDAVFGSISGKITCSFDGSGIKAFTKDEVKHGIPCSWKEKNGSDALVKDFNLFLVSYDVSNPYGEQPNGLRDYKVNAKTISGDLEVGDDSDDKVKVSLTLDMADYRNGTSHKVYIRSKTQQGDDSDTKEAQKVSFDSKPVLNSGKYKLTLLGCTNGVRTKGSVDIFAGQSPKAECEFAISHKVKGEGWRTIPTTKTVTLK